MKIKIILKNAPLIEAELKNVNGQATGHTFTTYKDITDCARSAEIELKKVISVKKYFPGARFVSTSGEPVAKSCKYRRIGTTVTIERGVDEWFLLDVKSVSLWFNQGGNERLYLTKEQCDRAVSELMNRFSVL